MVLRGEDRGKSQRLVKSWWFSKSLVEKGPVSGGNFKFLLGDTPKTHDMLHITYY